VNSCIEDINMKSFSLINGFLVVTVTKQLVYNKYR